MQKNMPSLYLSPDIEADKSLIIQFQDSFSAEEFVSDLFMSESFVLLPGYQCWDPRAWTVVPEFKKKWEFLFK